MQKFSCLLFALLLISAVEHKLSGQSISRAKQSANPAYPLTVRQLRGTIKCGDKVLKSNSLISDYDQIEFSKTSDYLILVDKNHNTFIIIPKGFDPKGKRCKLDCTPILYAGEDKRILQAKKNLKKD